MKVIKRNKAKEEFSRDKIAQSLGALSKKHGLASVDVQAMTEKVATSIYDNMTTAEIDALASEISASMTTRHPDYGVLASTLVVRNMHKTTPTDVRTVFARLCEAGILSDATMQVVDAFADNLDAMIDPTRDNLLDYFGLKTLEKGYLAKIDGKIAERPQHLWLRVALGIWGDRLDRVKETYELLSQKFFTHATPTLFNAGTRHPQLSSCYLLGTKADSIDGIFDTLKDCAQISKWAGGIGLHVHNVRAKNSPIKGTNGISNGLMPMLKVFNATARYVDQAGKRRGSIAIYLEPWHPDVFDVLEARKNHGDEEMRARDLFYALWIPDLFMKRVEANEKWSLMCPNKCPGLADVYGEEFEKLYVKYEKAKKYDYQVDAQKLWHAICTSQIETGTPYMLYKDACNKKSNQQHLGTIKSSNLCSEIVEYTSPEETAVCNLASLCLPRYVDTERKTFDFDMLHRVVQVVTRNLDRVIDVTYYPISEAKASNSRHRPIGIGVQGLADAFMMLGLDFESDEARTLNRDIFETIYHGALTASVALSTEHGPHASFKGSPASKGRLQFDLWGVDPGTARYDWDALKKSISKHGLRNSLLVAPMPTASTSQIMGSNECFEPYTSNIYVRRTLAGEFVVINKHLVRDLLGLGLWSDDMKNKIIASQGSIQSIPEIPSTIKAIYKTAWEIKQKTLIDMSADRGAFVCQSQSLNLFVGQPTFARLSSMHFYAWKRGLKTGMYYLRTQPAANPVQFTVDPQVCTSCSS
jgi:ribonucleoside-diphosphate reductase alpha chain